MSEDRALEVLGLSAVTSEQELKRAYLRQVKAHPPERDADRFREVREAYELLKQGAWVRQLVAAAPNERLVELMAEAPPVVAAAEPAPVVAAEEPPRVVFDELDEMDEPGPSFPPHVAKEIDALNKALAGDDPLSAAEAMIALYERPLLEEAPVPPPIFALKTFMVLMERRKFRTARSLLDAFEQHTQRHQSGSATGPDVAARWKLAREVLATYELDHDLASAVARGLRGGQLYTAGDAAEAAYHAHGSKLERHMKAKAPTVWGSIAHLIRPAQQEVYRARSGFGSGFKMGAWPVTGLAILAFKLVTFMAASASHSRPPTVYTEPPRIVDYSSGRARPLTSIERDLSLQLDPNTPEQQVSRSWAAVEYAASIGDCQTAREQWPMYVAALQVGHVGPVERASRRRKLLEVCAELKDLVEETQP